MHTGCKPPLRTLPRYKLPEAQVAAAVERALDLVNMSEFTHRATHTLSGGQRQRVAIAGGQPGGAAARPSAAAICSLRQFACRSADQPAPQFTAHA